MNSFAAEKTENALKAEKSLRYFSFAAFFVENVGCENIGVFVFNLQSLCSYCKKSKKKTS